MASTLSSADQEDSGHVLKNTAIAFMILESFFVILRYVSRAIIRAPTGIDDYLMPLAWLFNMALCGVALAMVIVGQVGRHVSWIAENDPEAITAYLKLQIPFVIMWAMAVMGPKLAILGLFLRIFTKHWHRVSCFVLVGLIAATGLVIILVTAMQCLPIAALWDPRNHPHALCINMNAFWRWGSFPNIVTDVLMLFLPMPCIWKLHLSTRDKIGVILTFATGSVGTITSIVRFATFFQTDGQADSTWSAVKLGCCSVAEPGVYLLAACLPTYRSLIRCVLQRLGVSKDSSQDSYLAGGDNTLCTFGERSTTLTAVQTKDGKKVFVSSIEDSLDETDFPRDDDDRVLVNSMSPEEQMYPNHDRNEGQFHSSDEGDAASSSGSACATNRPDRECETPPLNTIRIERDYKVVSSRRR